MSNSRKNTAVMSDHNLTVCLRIRPMNEDELNFGVPMITHIIDNNVVVLLDPLEDPDDILRANRSRERQFVLDHVFNSSCSQDEVFNLSTLPLISQVIDGFTATVFAYGPTGAGKTYTMLGVDEQPGIMFKALESLFNQMILLDDDFTFQMCLSYLEVYNEMIRDLLNPSSTVLDLREDQNGVQVSGITEKQVNTTNEVLDLLKRGNAARSVEATGANKHSSRSHCVLQVTVTSRSRLRNIQEQISKGKLFLIDLAGSERASNTLNRGKRMTEGAHINRSLLALGNCINALSDPNGKKYINYRDSKLTRLLKDALGGNCRTVMITHVSPTAPHFEDSRNTLVYADRAKHIRTKIHRNMYDVNFHLVQYNSIISELKQEINRLRNKLESFQSPTDLEETTIIPSMNEQVEEMKLKDQFLIVFQRHLDCKKSLSDIQTTDLDLSLEESRCQLILREWETKKADRIASRENRSNDSETREEEKQMEIAGMEFMSEPESVKMTKNEIRITLMEREKLQGQKQKLDLESEALSLKIKQMELTINERVKNPIAKEFLQLLCRLHKLEIHQSDLRMENVMLRQQGSLHDLQLTTMFRHGSLSKQIIAAQSSLIAEMHLELPKELEMLMELYLKDESTQDFSKSLFDNSKNYSNFNRRLILPDLESTSDIRDIASDLSIHENNQEEQTQRTPDTWDNDSLHNKIVKRTHDNFSLLNSDGPRKAFDTVLRGNTISKQQTYQQSVKPQNMSLLPDLRGRQIVKPIDNKQQSYRSRSYAPDSKRSKNNKDKISGVPVQNRYGNPNNRRLLMGPKLDNNLEQNNSMLRKYQTKYGIFKNPLLVNTTDLNANAYTREYKKTLQNDERLGNHRTVRANEIRKLNERRARDGLHERDTINDINF